MPPTNNLDPDLSALTFPTTEEEAEDSTLFPPRNLHPSTGPSNFRTRLESISSQTTGGATSIYTDANDQSGARSSQATFRLAQEGESDTEGEGGGRSYSFVDADESIRRDSMSTIARSVAESQDDGVTPRASRFIPEGMEHHQQQQQLSHDEAKVPAEGRVTELAGLAALSTIPIAASIPDHQSSSTKTSSEPLRIQPNLLSHNSGAGSSSTTSNSIVTPTGLGLNKGASSHGESEKGSSEKRKGGKDVGSEIVEMEDPELAGLNEEQKRIVREQIHEIKRTPATFVELFRFTTKFEIFLNALGILGAIVSGAAQPLMTVVFGSLTTAFVAFNTAALSDIASPTYAEDLALAKDHLFGIVNADVLYLVYIGIAMFVATFVYMGTWIYTGEITTRRIRERYLQSVLRQNVAYFDKIGAGEVTTRIQTDMSLIQEGISDKIPITVMFLSTFVTGFVVAFVRNWRLALVVSTIVPAIAIAGSLMNKYMSEYRRLMLEQTAVGGTLVEEVVSSVRNTHAFGTQKKLASMYDVNNVKTLNLGIRSSIVNAVGMLIFFFIIYCAYALAFFYGTTLILEGKANAGQIVNVFFAILIGAFSLAQIAPNLQALSFALGAATSIFATIDRVPIIDSSSTSGIKPAAVEGFIEFNNVDFIYPARPSVQVLHDFTAQFPRGKMTALVGASGSGKSTIVGLIERFYDPVGGSIKVDGVELRELNVKWLRTQIGLVSQEPTLFATTVAGNIEHGLIGTAFENESPELRRQRVIAAAVQANADGFITSLPESYDTMIGERGMLLSGGQKQRIAIARAIVGNPQILLLDEATSALDTASEAIVQDALDRASTGRTTITIAHRLSTIKDADQIIVMSAGRILESALTEGDRSAHVELLSRDGAYSRLVTAQRFRERTTTEGDDSETASIIEEKTGGLTRAEADELAKNEKPMFENLRRAGTGMSAASEALAAKNGDLENGDKEKQGHSFPYLLYRILLLNKADRWTYVAGVIASIVVGVTYPVFAIVFGGVIGAFSQTGSTLRTAGNHYAGICFAIAIVSAIAVGVQSYSFGSSAERLSRILRVGTFAAILRQDIAYFDRDENSTGHLTSSVSDWAQKIQGLFGITAGVIIQSCFTLIAGSIVGLSYAWKVALVGISCFPFTIAAGLVRLQVVVLKDAKNKKAHEASAQMACEAAGAIRTVASLTREDDCCEIYSGYLDGPQKQSNRTAIYANAWYSLSQSLTFWVIGLIFWYGSHQLAAQEINSKQFFVAMIGVIFGSIQAGQVFTYVPDMSKARGAADDVVKLLDSTPEIDAENATGAKFEDCQGSIRFNDVHFRYPTRPHVRVLRGLNLEVKPGQFVAIVGPSGCGKSTLIQLVERFYDPLAGTVTVDGQDISELNIQSYREHISLVSQEPTLYAGSVRFNITLGATVPADQVSQADVEQACKDANIHDFVLSLPDGYDTEVGGKGAQLSGGQKQRIAIARALIRNPKILLLDEATSALDSESEKVVQAALDQAAKGRTTIAVAHRLSTIQGADVIYILKDGKVAEQGKHFELLAKNGIYAELVSQQNLEKRS